MLVAGVGPGAQLLQVAAIGQQPGQIQGSVSIAGVGAAAQYQCRLVEVSAPGQKPD